MKHNYIDRAKVFIEAVYPHIHDFEHVESVSSSIQQFNALKHRNVIVSCGLSRIALVTSDYVVKWDYARITRYGCCETEYQLYYEHKNDSFSYLLAPIYRYTTHGKDFYIMPRVMKLAEQIDDDLEIERYLSDDEYVYIFEDLKLRDVHSGNWGFHHGGIPVIFDYAWYEDKDDEESNEGTWSS